MTAPGRRDLLLGAASTVGMAACERKTPAASAVTRPSAPRPPGAMPDAASAPSLKDHFAPRFRIGMAVEPRHTTQPVDRALILRHANSVTAANVMKPVVLAPREGVYTFQKADALVAFARANGIAMQGTTLVWHQTAPDWFFAGDPSDVGYKAMVGRRLERFVTDVVTHFKGKVWSWIVVNEPTCNVAGDPYRPSRWYQVLGTDYIDIAFRAARAADPDAQLLLNEYLTEEPGKCGRFLAILDGMLKRGVPVDGVGHQMHVGTGPKGWDLPVTFPASNTGDALKAVEARGLANHVTELDVSIYADPPGCFAAGQGCLPELTGDALAQALRVQTGTYRDLFDVFLAHGSLKSVTMWGIRDGRGWLDEYPAKRANHPFLFDEAGQPKRAFWAVVDPAFVP